MLSLPGRGQRFVFEMHEILHEQKQNAAKAEAYKRMEFAVLQRADGVVVTNASLAEKVRDISAIPAPFPLN
jgi:hypothetical protein